jgi:DNA-binding transcriptional ArsR family regulator/uncharacterized protein YndB with AHSA1/START domain
VEKVFKALADATRRKLLDALRKREGQTLSELEARFEMSRFGVMKHLRLLEQAGLVVTRKVGREKLHYLNPVPIQSISDRWISKYARRWTEGLTGLKRMMEASMDQRPKHLFQIWIRTTPEALWKAITDPEVTQRYFFDTRVESTFEKGAPIAYVWDGQHALDGEVLEFDPPRRLVTSFVMTHDEKAKLDAPSRVSWEIEQQGELCRLTVLHDDFAGETATYRNVVSGWPYILSGLKSWLETGTSLPRPAQL